VVSNQDAINHFVKTGQHLGMFDNDKDADTYAQTLHEGQARQYLPRTQDDESEMIRKAAMRLLGFPH
jgi:hypothetical protein